MFIDNLLLHICCYPCFYTCIEKFCIKEMKIDGFFFNPNIHPYKEYKMRKRTLVENSTLKIFYQDYSYISFIKNILEAKDRCFACYTFRLEKLVYYAKENKYHYISTTLLASPYQKHDMIEDIINNLSKKNDLKYFNIEVVPDYKEKINELKNKNIYIQKYCGCIISEYERYSYK